MAGPFLFDFFLSGEKRKTKIHFRKGNNTLKIRRKRIGIKQESFGKSLGIKYKRLFLDGLLRGISLRWMHNLRIFAELFLDIFLVWLGSTVSVWIVWLWYSGIRWNAYKQCEDVIKVMF